MVPTKFHMEENWYFVCLVIFVFLVQIPFHLSFRSLFLSECIWLELSSICWLKVAIVRLVPKVALVIARETADLNRFSWLLGISSFKPLALLATSPSMLALSLPSYLCSLLVLHAFSMSSSVTFVLHACMALNRRPRGAVNLFSARDVA